jgi:hypothetical protein
LDYIFLAFCAYSIGQLIFIFEMMGKHPQWRAMPLWLFSLAWPYLTVRRCIVAWRTDQDG